MLDKNVIFTLLLLVGTFVLFNVSKYFLNKIGTSKKVSKKRIYYVSKSINILILILAILLLVVIWSVSLNGILVFTSSIFAVVGVALFAQWSILSNITSSVLIFFSFPTRIGDIVKIVDGDNSVEGEIVEISLFHVKLLNDEGNLVIYPNNLFTQKPIIKKRKNKSAHE